MITTIDGQEIFLGEIEEWARKRTGKCQRTISRWRAKGWPPEVVRLAALELYGHVGLISPVWQGWQLTKAGELIAPSALAPRSYYPQDLLAAPLLHELQRELERRKPPQAVSSQGGNDANDHHTALRSAARAGRRAG